MRQNKNDEEGIKKGVHGIIPHAALMVITVAEKASLGVNIPLIPKILSIMVFLKVSQSEITP